MVYTGDPDVICLVWHNCLSSCVTLQLSTNTHSQQQFAWLSDSLAAIKGWVWLTGCHEVANVTHWPPIHKHTDATTAKNWRELCRGAPWDPDNLKWLASTLVRAPYSWSGGPEFDRTWCTDWKWKTLGVRSYKKFHNIVIMDCLKKR